MPRPLQHKPQALPPIASSARSVVDRRRPGPARGANREHERAGRTGCPVAETTTPGQPHGSLGAVARRDGHHVVFGRSGRATTRRWARSNASAITDNRLVERQLSALGVSASIAPPSTPTKRVAKGGRRREPSDQQDTQWKAKRATSAYTRHAIDVSAIHVSAWAGVRGLAPVRDRPLPLHAPVLRNFDPAMDAFSLGEFPLTTHDKRTPTLRIRSRTRVCENTRRFFQTAVCIPSARVSLAWYTCPCTRAQGARRKERRGRNERARHETRHTLTCTHIHPNLYRPSLSYHTEVLSRPMLRHLSMAEGEGAGRSGALTGSSPRCAGIIRSTRFHCPGRLRAHGAIDRLPCRSPATSTACSDGCAEPQPGRPAHLDQHADPPCSIAISTSAAIATAL